MTDGNRKKIEAQLARLEGSGGLQRAIEALRNLADEAEVLAGAKKGSGRTAKKPRSAKAKGRAGVVEAKKWIRDTFGLEDDDLLIQTTSVGGSDIHYSPSAKRAFPYAPEVKNQEAMNVWAALAQAELNAKKKGLKPVLFFKRNGSPLYIAFKAEDLTFCTVCKEGRAA